MKFQAHRLIVAVAGVVSVIAGASLHVRGANVPASAPAPTSAPVKYDADGIPEIPVERIRFLGTGYSQIPPDVEVLINQRQDVWDRMSPESFMRAMPEVEK